MRSFQECSTVFLSRVSCFDMHAVWNLPRIVSWGGFDFFFFIFMILFALTPVCPGFYATLTVSSYRHVTSSSLCVAKTSPVLHEGQLGRFMRSHPSRLCACD